MTSTSIPPLEITGLVLAGGRGSRMGGVDKGLQHFQGQPLALRAMQRLAPQVASVMINANRHLAEYQALGVPVWPDALEDYPGPLAGMLAGLTHCDTPYLVCVPCDSPLFPLDLVAKMSQALHDCDADVVLAATREKDGTVQRQPVFCLMKTSLAGALAQALRDGERKIDRWAEQHRCVWCEFEDPQAFANANTLDELRQLQEGV